MDGRQFETEVLRIARALWKSDASGGPEHIDGRERDGVFYEEDLVHLLEVTIDKSEEKAKQDIKKLSRLASDMRRRSPERAIKCWFITLHEPTDRQRAVARNANYPVNAVGFKEFQAKIINARDYLKAREGYRFGSVQSPSEERPLKFIPMDIKERQGSDLRSILELTEGLLQGRRIALTADYGAGKSMVLRELFSRLSQKYQNGHTTSFPIHINLRDHSGSQYPDEILERHARAIGFSEPHKLVRAWRAGYVILLIDGFDEITSLGFQGRWSKLKELRHKALVAVRELISSQPADSGVIVAGREYYFDSYEELKSSLGLGKPQELTLNEFTEEQVMSLLQNLGISSVRTPPAWMPKRPLFVATLALQGFLTDLRGVYEATIGDGWNELIDRICAREATISPALDAATIRQVLERVSTAARCKPYSSSLSRKELVDSFSSVCDYEPDEHGLLLLERLPGLGMIEAGSEARQFVDSEFEGALGAGDVSRYFMEPWNISPALQETQRTLTSVGVAVSGSILRRDTRTPGAQQAIDRASDYSCLLFDSIQISREMETSFCGSATIKDLHIENLDTGGGEICTGKLYFSECIIDHLELDPTSSFCSSIRLQGCIIRSLAGVHSSGDIPHELLDARCEIEEISDQTSTNAGILSTDIPLPLRVMLVILRKLYTQAGAARRENAFFRGLDGSAQRYVADILDILGSEGLAFRERRGGEPLVVPNRSAMSRVLDVIKSPETSADPLVFRVRDLV